MDVEFSDIVVEYGKTRVLHQVCGKAVCGQILAIIGPSGSGKSTLLNALAGRVRLTSGVITLGNQKATKRLRRHIAYVTQEDVFFPNITLKETLMFSAMLRLPDTMTYKEKVQRVETIVNQFDLGKCINTIMGDVTVRGLSGGERKRANIACEMITNMDVIIADEPTSGLDSATAHKVMTLLQVYAETQQKTAIITLHQPSSRLFHMCADILVLSSGKVAYNGAIHGMVDFLANIDLQCPSYFNPADFILEKLKESVRTEDRIIQAALLSREQKTEDIMLQEMSDCTSGKGHINNACELDSSFPVEMPENEDAEHSEAEVKWMTGFWTQYKMLCRRELKQVAPIYFSLTSIFTCAVVAILAGLLWFQLPRTPDKIHSRLGLIFMCQIYFTFAATRITIASYKLERTIVVREHTAGMYRLSAYYLSKMTSEFLMNVVEPFFFYIFVYWMAGLSSEPWIFICSLLLLEVAVLTAAGVGLLFAVIVDHLGTVLLIANIYNVAVMILGGFYVVNDTKWFEWTKYLSCIYFTTTAASKLEFLYGSGLRIEELDTNHTMCPFDDTVAAFETRLQEGLPLWLDCVFGILYLIVYWLAVFVVLRWLKKPQLSL